MLKITKVLCCASGNASERWHIADIAYWGISCLLYCRGISSNDTDNGLLRNILLYCRDIVLVIQIMAYWISCLLYCRGISPDDTDNAGMTVLHIACDTGRSHNVDLLLSRASKGLNWYLNHLYVVVICHTNKYAQLHRDKMSEHHNNSSRGRSNKQLPSHLSMVSDQENNWLSIFCIFNDILGQRQMRVSSLDFSLQPVQHVSCVIAFIS